MEILPPGAPCGPTIWMRSFPAWGTNANVSPRLRITPKWTFMSWLWMRVRSHSAAPVTVQNLILHSTNITVSDSMNVDQTLLLDGQSFTLLGEISLSGALQNWTGANAPHPPSSISPTTVFLIFANNAHFGDDTATNYVAFVNHGTINAGSQTINSADFEILRNTIRRRLVISMQPCKRAGWRMPRFLRRGAFNFLPTRCNSMNLSLAADTQTR